jgi:predicted nuclease of predicted toxin-antitoxin system
MKFIVDAQLPLRLARFLQDSGYDIPQQNATPDSVINTISLQDERIVITKDSDFVDSFLTIQQPYKLLLITTGNIKNSDLEDLFMTNLTVLIDLLSQHSYIELSRDTIIVHQ